MLFSGWFPLPSLMKVICLRWLGADIGVGVKIRNRVNVKFPWRLSIGDHSWIGEGAWIDNLAEVKIGSNVCVSQDTYLCTGSHDWNTNSFNLVIKPIIINNHAWVGARSTVGPGVTVGEGAILGLGSTTTKDLQPWKIYLGSPADFVRDRVKPVANPDKTDK